MNLPVSTPAPAPVRLRAPQADRVILSSPPLRQGLRIARENVAILERSGAQIGTRTLQEFRRWARTACLDRARSWMKSNLGIEILPVEHGLLMVTGHQPQLNHAGVWMKNVAIGRLAECCGGQGLNLIVDNDLTGSTAVRCLAGTLQEPAFVDIPYDTPVATQPWEEVSLQDSGLFASFADRVSAALAPWNIEPILNQVWSAGIDAQSRTRSLATLLSAVRVQLERQVKIQNLELPVSEMCQTQPFLAFVAHVCRNHQRFFVDYNKAVHAYRLKYRVRNHRHPVPDLELQEDRFELPFWFWRRGDHDRSRVFVRQQGETFELYAGDEYLTSLSGNPDDLSSLIQLQQVGRLRTRALTTTLFARLCLGDLFIHGIGGARYDEITDDLMQSFFHCKAPGFITLTATLHLPQESYRHTPADVARLKNRLRHLHFSGETGSANPRVLALQMRRAALLDEASLSRQADDSKRVRRARHAENRQRHRELKRVQKELSELAAESESTLKQELELVRGKVQANAVLKSREFAACLFSEDRLNALIGDLRREICGR